MKKRIIIYAIVILIAQIAIYLLFVHVPTTQNDYWRFRLTDGRELVAKAPAGSKICNPVKIGNSFYYWHSAVCNNENHFTDAVNDISIK